MIFKSLPLKTVLTFIALCVMFSAHAQNIPSFINFNTSISVSSVDEDSSLCELSEVIALQYFELASLLTLPDDMDSDGLPEEAILELVEELACRHRSTVLTDAVVDSFAANMAALDQEIDIINSDIDNLLEIVAVLMMISDDTQLALETALAGIDIYFVETYSIVEVADYDPCNPNPALDLNAVLIEQLSGAGDLDGDGLTNADEYQITVIDNGQSLEEFGVEANGVCVSGGSGSASCFIATAAFGTPFTQEIDTLREIRDNHLLNNAFGLAFTDTYYRVSPPIADVVSTNPLLALLIRIGIGGLLSPTAWALFLSGCILGGTHYLTRRKRL